MVNYANVIERKSAGWSGVVSSAIIGSQYNGFSIRKLRAGKKEKIKSNCCPKSVFVAFVIFVYCESPPYFLFKSVFPLRLCARFFLSSVTQSFSNQRTRFPAWVTYLE